jgi:hypothetical protein
MIHRRPLLLGALALAAACSAHTASPSIAVKPDGPITPDVVSMEALTARLEPSAGEKALLVNFWATW